MSDLVKMPQFAHVNDVVEWQAARIEALEAALKPFALEAQNRTAMDPAWRDNHTITITVRISELRHAASLLEKKP